MENESIKKANKILHFAKSIVIVAHRNPDGDAIGSSLGLYHFLKSVGYNVTVIMPNDFPKFLKWLPGVDFILIHDTNQNECEEIIEKADIIFTLDFNILERVGDGLKDVLEKAEADFIMIDHHQQPGDYATVVFSDTSMSSTAEMVFHFIKALNFKADINPEIATCLYAGILTDTGSFRFSSTSPTTHRVIAELMENGANNTLIYQNIFDTQTPDRLKLLGIALENMQILPEYRTAFITLSQKELDQNNFRKGDTEGFVNYGLSVENIVFAVIFIENEQEQLTKISFRSSGNFSVNKFARKYFNGGGHNNAAGGRSSLSLDETVKYFISILPRYKDELQHVI